ncbi:MAG: flagellar filament capping protein FliD [Planctomycetaceae bacterium]
MLSIDGLVTGIDTASIIEGLTGIQQNQLDLLNSRRSSEVDRQTAFKGVEAGVLNLRSVANRLGRSQGSVFSTRQATSSSENLTATAASDAAVGVYSVTVNQLAQAHQIGSEGLSGATAEITQGTFSLRVGSGETTDITVDSSNNTLQGLADAINDADGGVQATIINDGTSGGSSYRLMLTSGQTGASNAITLTNNLADSAGSAVKPDFSGPAIQEATNAQLTLGSGPGAITVESETNTVEDVISGVTMQLSGADVDEAISLTVSRNTETAATAVSDFVDAFNNVMEYIDDNSAYNVDTAQAGALLGNRSTLAIQDDLRRAVTDTVPGLNPNANRLSAIGISVSNSGRLVLNESRLNEVLSGRVPEISDSDLSKLFSFSGDSSNANVRFLGGSTRTQDGTPVEVDITQAATQATATATNTLAALTTIDSSNNTFSIEVDGAAATVTLLDGDYTNEALASLVQDALNSSTDLSGRSLAVGVEGGQLQITSETYGRASEIGALSGTALSALGFDGTESDQGQDVVGRFIVNGVEETAIGRGRLLTGDADNEYTGDLRISVTMTDAQVQSGVDAELNLTRGVGSRLDQLLGSLLDPTSGRIKTANDEFDAKIEDIDNTIAKQNEIFEARRIQLEEEFVALESAVQQLQSQGNFLAAQLGGGSSSLPSLG